MPRFPVQLYLKDINPNLPAPWGSHPQNRFGLKEINKSLPAPSPIFVILTCSFVYCRHLGGVIPNIALAKGKITCDALSAIYLDFLS
jgi:hypothetical protein